MIKIWHVKVTIGNVITVRQLHARSEAEASALAERWAAAASTITGDPHRVDEILEDYPSEFILSAGKVADLEYMARRMKGGSG